MPETSGLLRTTSNHSVHLDVVIGVLIVVGQDVVSQRHVGIRAPYARDNGAANQGIDHAGDHERHVSSAHKHRAWWPVSMPSELSVSRDALRPKAVSKEALARTQIMRTQIKR